MSLDFFKADCQYPPSHSGYAMTQTEKKLIPIKNFFAVGMGLALTERRLSPLTRINYAAEEMVEHL